MCEHTKIDAKPIFTVPDMRPNLASISGTVEMRVTSTLLGLNTSTCYVLLIVSGHNPDPAVQFWGQTLGKIFYLVKNLCSNIYI